MDSFMQNHQSALDSFMEDKAIQDLENAGIYPVPDNDAILENIAENYYIQPTYIEDGLTMSIRYVIRDQNENLVRHNDRSFFATKEEAEKTLCEIVQKRFEESAQWLSH